MSTPSAFDFKDNSFDRETYYFKSQHFIVFFSKAAKILLAFSFVAFQNCSCAQLSLACVLRRKFNVSKRGVSLL